MSVSFISFHLFPSRSLRPSQPRSGGHGLLSTVLLCSFAATVAAADSRGGQGHHDGRDAEDVSPARRIDRRAGNHHLPTHPEPPTDTRSIDGRFNNASDPELGAAHTPLLRRFESDYVDGVSSMAGADRPSARAVSNAVHAQTEGTPNIHSASDFLWQWGQFLDHDIDLTDGADPAEPENILVPPGDPFFDPVGTGTQEIAFNRSIWEADTGTDVANPREQLNEITAWIDASNVYGSDAARAAALRMNDGTGRLATSEGNLLPFNTIGLPNAGGSMSSLFLAGDVRANEQVGLIAMYTLFMREHNRLVAELALENPGWSGDELYQKARQLVGGLMQAITYREFLPALLGRHALDRYRGYDEEVDATIANAFSSAAYRFGHSALSPTLLRLDANGNEIQAGHLALRDAFFSPSRITDEGGIAPLLRGLAAQPCQTVDAMVIDDVRNFLFGPPGSGGFDLASLNIQRGRDHGLPSYNDVRRALGLTPASDFSDISSDPEVTTRLASVYASTEDIDLWTGGLSEESRDDGHLGETFTTILIEQFEALRSGDRFWYERALSPNEVRKIESRRLADVIRANTTIGDELSDDVFRVGKTRERSPRDGDRRDRRR